MQNLFWKFSVLMAVVGASCFVAWQAHQSLSENTQEENPTEFTSLESQLGTEVVATSDGVQDQLLQPIPGFEQPNSPTPEPQPTPAAPLFGQFDKDQSDARSVVIPVAHQFSEGATATNFEDHRSADQPESVSLTEANPFLQAVPQPANDPQPAPVNDEDNPFLSSMPPRAEPAQRETAVAVNPFAIAEEVEPEPAEPADNGLTTLPPSHPGPVLLPASDSNTQSAMPSDNRLHNAGGFENHNRVQPTAGEEANIFLPLNPNDPEENEAVEVLPELADPKPLMLDQPEEEPTPVLPADAGFGAPAEQPATPDVSPNPFMAEPAGASETEVMPTPLENTPTPDPEPFSFGGPETNTPTLEQPPTQEMTPEPAPFEFGNPEPQRSSIPANSPSPATFEPTLGNFNPEPQEPASSIPTNPPATNYNFDNTPNAGYNSSIPTQPQTINHELLGDGTFDPSMPSGPQSPELKIEKIAPQEATIGQPLVYSIIIRNVGGSEARHVVVEDRIPRGAKLDGTIPQAVFTNGKLVWELGTLAPNSEKKIQLRVIPVEAGDIGSVATVRFAASVATSIRVTAPKLSLTMNGPSEVLVGKPAVYDFSVTNSGQGAAKQVYLRALIPPGLTHPGGNDLEYEIGDLAPGASKNVQLSMTATKMGIFTPQASVSIDGDPKDEAKQDLRIIESRLQITRSGPSRRFVSRAGTYTTKVTNQSNAVLRNVDVIEEVPRNVEPPANLSNWNPQNRTITWTIPVINPNETKEFTTQLTPQQPGEYLGRLLAQDSVGNRAAIETKLDVKGVSDLEVDIDRNLIPIGVGEQVSLRMSVANTGNASARNVQTAFQIPNTLQFVTAKGPVKYAYDAQTNIVTFDSIPELIAGGSERKFDFDIVLTGAQPSKAEVKVYVSSDEENQQFTKKVEVLGYEVESTSAARLGQ